jgi:hypothetical protein
VGSEGSGKKDVGIVDNSMTRTLCIYNRKIESGLGNKEKTREKILTIRNQI